MVNPLCTNEALYLFKRLTPEFPLGSVWLPSFVKSLSRVLYCCVDGKVFSGNWSVSPRHHHSNEARGEQGTPPPHMAGSAYFDRLCFMGTPVMFPRLGQCAPRVPPDIVDVSSLLRGKWKEPACCTKPHSARRAFPPLSPSPSIYQKGGP